MHQALKSVPFPLCIVVESGDLLLVSDATYALTGLVPGEIRTLQDWVEGALRDPSVTERVLSSLQASLDQPEVRQRGTHTVWTTEGAELLWEFTAAPLGRSIEGKRMLTAVAYDITERELARQALEESSAYKDEFLAMLGHELRNPLAGIRNGVQLLKMSDTVAETAEATGIIDRQSAQMTSLIDGLLDLSRIARGKVSLDPRPLDLGALTASLVADWTAGFADKGLSLSFHAALTPIWVRGDRVRLQQVIDNLLGNSLKFTQTGGQVAVALSALEGSAVLSVKDDGLGMTPELAAVVFEPFRQGPQTLSRSYGGLGLGLSLVKLIAELHDGSVTVESAGPRQGSEFRLTLPRCEESTEESTEDFAAPRAWSILVVEDNQDFGGSLERLLEGVGHEVRRCTTGAGALSAVGERAPEVILCDIGLPDIEGFELMRRFQELPSLSGVPVVAMTGYGLSADKARSAIAEFSAHLTKPFDLEAVQRLLHGFAGRTEQAASAALPERLRRILVVDDNAMVASSLQKMLEKSGFTARYARSAPEAVEVAKAFRPEVALLDLGLPGRSGFELKQDMAALEECAGCLYLALTGSDSSEDKERTREAGFRAHLVKPVSLESLIAEISSLGHLAPLSPT